MLTPTDGPKAIGFLTENPDYNQMGQSAPFTNKLMPLTSLAFRNLI